ncbi:MAG: flavodoxin [Nocardioidaceae bacterium]|nr:flavodoxin [Nocardioidaceae bacterium]NUS51517.1 flavodoxin [Nocardioidaceae bacterium]
MRALVVYESMWGNTRAVAEAVGATLAGRMEVRVADVGEVPAGEVAEYDLVVAGAPTHAFSLSRASTRQAALEQGAPESSSTYGLREWIAALPAPTDTRVACFDTRVERVRNLPGSAARKAARLLRRAGWDVVARQSFYVSDTAGPLLPAEVDRASAWAGTLVGARV